MSLSLLSRQDVENWVPEPAPSKGGAGFVTKLFAAIDRGMASLVGAARLAQNEEFAQWRNEYERFFLWGQGLSITDGELDETLALSKELHFRVLSLFLRLGTVILQGLSLSPATSSQVNVQCDELRTLLDATGNMLTEPDSDEAPRPHTPSESESSEYGMMDVLGETSVYIDCLLDLSPSLERPALDIQVENYGEHQTRPKEFFTASCEEGLAYCRRIRDRFEALPKYLVERLAEANVTRAVALREKRSQPAKAENIVVDGVTESLFSKSDPRFTEVTKSSAPSSSMFSAVLSASSEARLPPLLLDDNMSEATFASFSTTKSAASLGRPRVPPIPEIVGEGFTCHICFTFVTNVTTRKEWKQHVFNDLKPYICTIERCQGFETLYSHSSTWAQHEISHSPSDRSSSECPFCSATYQERGTAYYKHISSHFREVSLQVLPPTADDDDDELDTDESGVPSPEPEPVMMDLDAEDAGVDTIAAGPEIEGTEPSTPAQMPGSGTTDITGKTERQESQSMPDSGSASAPAEIIAAPETSGFSYDEDLDSIIDRLLEVRGSRPGRQVQLLEAEIRYLCTKAREIFISQPILLELEPPMKIMGDLHGQYYDLLRAFEYGGFPPDANYLFLGNYVDHGKQSLETICLLLAYKIKYPENFFILRGNHECASINRIEGFYDECKRRYNIRLWKTFIDLFNCMPVAAIIDEKVFCMHGGLSPDLNSMEQIRRIMRPTDVPDCGLLCDLLWSTPDKDITGWSENDRGTSFTFGPDVVSRFLQKHDMDLIVRSDQVVEDGYEFFSKRQLVTIWGAPNYRGEYDNAGSMMSIDENLMCSFQILLPAEINRKFGRR